MALAIEACALIGDCHGAALVGFLPAEDPRVRGTVESIERERIVDGLVQRCVTTTGVDGLPPGEGIFPPCSFWLADNLMLIGRDPKARALFDRLLAPRNDVGPLAEEHDPQTGHMLGNFPQAPAHMALVNTARLLSLPAAQGTDTAGKGDRPAAA